MPKSTSFYTEGLALISWFNNTSGVAVVTPTDRPTCKLVRNRCVIEGFGGVLCCRVLDFSVGVGIFVMGLSQISSFFSTYFNYLFQSF